MGYMAIRSGTSFLLPRHELTSQIDTGLPWTSFQLLNSKFRDVVIEQGDSRIQPSRYQIGYTGRRTPVQGVGALNSLVVDYEVSRMICFY